MQQVANRLDAVQAELTSLTTRIVAAEGELTNLKKDTKKVSVVICNTQEKLQSYEREFADLEDRSRRRNIRVYGMPENAEQGVPVQFLERMIPEWFPTLKHLKPEIERAHRINSRGLPKEGDRPQAFIFCCLRFSIQQSILREARKHPLSVGNRVLWFAADYSDYTAKRCRVFSRAMAIARGKGTCHSQDKIWTVHSSFFLTSGRRAVSGPGPPQ